MKAQKRSGKAGWYSPDGRTVRRGLPDGHMRSFWSGIERLRQQLFEKDEDGDWPVQVIVIDRTTHQKLHYFPLPHAHADGWPPPAEVLDELLRAADVNLGTASDEFKRIAHDVRDFIRRHRAKQEKP